MRIVPRAGDGVVAAAQLHQSASRLSMDLALQNRVAPDQVETTRALSREEQQMSPMSGNANAGRNSAAGGNVRTKKIFVGGPPGVPGKLWCTEMHYLVSETVIKTWADVTSFMLKNRDDSPNY
ncbi:Heterogeneous nuclear ribonucleoprotein 1 [Nymphaea thermarum]|nr:Heterogeneous nuclear ribonucleoprotein 1 [Nymphaea thermarum]